MTTSGSEPSTGPGGASPAAPPATAHLYAGPVDRPDEYELTDAGHKGGEGVVFQARYRGSLPRAVPFAVKQLVAPPGTDPAGWPEAALVERWREQLKLLHLLRHQHLVGYRDLFHGWPPHPAGTVTGEPPAELRTWYLVMEWVEGPSLHELVRSGRSPLLERAGYIAQLAEAVEYLHSGADTAGMAVLHRDIKPGNVIIDSRRGAVLVDFGLARVEEPTLTELPAWTGPYLAPEVHADKTRTSRASDMWAVAATAFFAFTAAQPSPFDTEQMRREILQQAGDQSEQAAGVAATLMEALDQSPEHRPASPINWANDLLKEARELDPSAHGDLIPTGAPPPAPGGARPAPWRRRKSFRLSAAIAAAALVAAASVITTVTLASTPASHLTNTNQTVTTNAPGVTTSPAPGTGPGATGITGTVRDNRGQPVAGAYVIGLNSVAVARSDTEGRYSIPCNSEPLVAGAWVLPVFTAQPKGIPLSYGQNTTSYGPPPTFPGLGYSFSGGSADADRAANVTCDGHTHDFALPPGGNVNIHILDASGAPASETAAPPDNFYLPGLDEHAAVETVPIDSSGAQNLYQLGPGVLQIVGANTTLTCSGDGVIPNPSIDGANATVTAGITLTVTCQQS